MAEITRRTELPEQPLVTCHGDYRPGNWIQDDKGRIHVIDFGAACLEPWAFDLTRLAMGTWWGKPDLARAFLEGYGRELSDDDRRLIATQGAVHAVVLLRRALHHGNAQAEARGRGRLHALMGGRPAIEV